jgi:MobA-like NTP transferase domain
VLLAAGLGSRFGGVKPLAPIGPDHEPLLQLALAQAVDAGFRDAVVVTGGASRSAIETAIAGWTSTLAVACARQDGVGPAREKPWGTVAALLAAARHAPDRDLVVANGDDLYGVPGLHVAQQWPATATPDEAGRSADVAIIAYPAARTLSPNGGVSRAVPVVDRRGRLVQLVEHRDVKRVDHGIRTAAGLTLSGDDPVSMNLWVFRRPAVQEMATAFEEFVGAHEHDAAAELGLPDAVGALVRRGRLDVDVLVTDSPWHGVTWPADTERVRAELQAEHGR